MEEMISNIVKVLSHTILVHIYSYPHFAIELFLAAVLCVVHCLLIIEVNRVYQRTNAKAAARLRIRHTPFQEMEGCSFHTISRLQTQMLPQTIQATQMKRSFYSPSYVNKRINRKLSAASNFGWVVSQGDSLLKNGFEDRVEHLLAISPSEYVRKDKARKYKEADLKSCIQSLTSVLENVFVTDAAEMNNISKETLKRSLELLRDSFEHQFTREVYTMGEFNPQLHPLLENSITKKTLQNALQLHPSGKNSRKSVPNNRDTPEDEQDSTIALAESSSENLNEFFKENITREIPVDFITLAS